MSRLPTQLRPRLAIRSRANLRHHRHQMLASDDPGNPGRQMKRTLGTDDLGQRRKPLPDLGGIIVDDVVDAAGLAVFEGLDCRCRGVIDMDERPPAGAIADQGRSALADLARASRDPACRCRVRKTSRNAARCLPDGPSQSRSPPRTGSPPAWPAVPPVDRDPAHRLRS